MTNQNQYLFHWLTPDKLTTLSTSGIMKPSWKHFILEQNRFVRGISFCEEPMLWHPDEELPREPCIIIDRTKLNCPIHYIDSSQEYHLTKAIGRAKRRGDDIANVIEGARRSRKFVSSRPDEVFIEGPVKIDFIVATGYQSDDHGKARDAAASFSDCYNLPILDMTDWDIGCPGFRETDDEIREAISTLGASTAPSM